MEGATGGRKKRSKSVFLDSGSEHVCLEMDPARKRPDENGIMCAGPPSLPFHNIDHSPDAKIPTLPILRYRYLLFTT